MAPSEGLKIDQELNDEGICRDDPILPPEDTSDQHAIISHLVAGCEEQGK
jgi:hypothetical protein